MLVTNFSFITAFSSLRKGNENNKSTGVILKINPLAHRPPLYRYATQQEN